MKKGVNGVGREHGNCLSVFKVALTEWKGRREGGLLKISDLILGVVVAVKGVTGGENVENVIWH